ncbi:hypothetical protein MXD62_13320 [Frankia sp. Mgl5]|nr:hypothetical protein [Frankia sp. Mgl5]
MPGAEQDATVMRGIGRSQPPAGGRGAGALPPSVARVAARIRLSAELLAAILEVEERTWATLDDMERADALADRLLARRRDRLAATADAGLDGASTRTCWRTTATTASFSEAVRENEEVVPVNVSTWVLPSGVTVGR